MDIFKHSQEQLLTQYSDVYVPQDLLNHLQLLMEQQLKHVVQQTQLLVLPLENVSVIKDTLKQEMVTQQFALTHNLHILH